MKRYIFIIIISLTVLLTATISFCEAVDTSKLVFVVMKPKPASGDQVITLTFWQNDEIIAVMQYQSGKLLKSEGKIPDGPVLELHDNGSLNNVVNMSGGNRHGIVVSYYKNGVLRSDGWYSRDNPDGEMRSYSENGVLTEIHHFDEGRTVKIEKFAENGQLIKTEEY